MLADEIGEVLGLETPTKHHADSTDGWCESHAFYTLAKECLHNFLQCKDIEIVYDVRNEFREFCAKILRASAHMGRTNPLQPDLNAPLEKLRVLGSEVQRVIVECQRRLHICAEYHELYDTVFLAVQKELEDLQSVLFQITESTLSPRSRAQPSIGTLYAEIKARIDPLKASVQFIPMRVECYKLSAQDFFPESVAHLTVECSKLTSRVYGLIQEFERVDALLKLEWWDPHLEKAISPETHKARPKSTPSKLASSIPVFNLRLRGQRKSVPPKFISKLPKPTEVKSRPTSMDSFPPQLSRGHYRTSSTWSSSSTWSCDSLNSPLESVSSEAQPKIFDQAPLCLPPSDPIPARPQSRLIKPTPIDLTKLKTGIAVANANKENEDFSGIPVSASRRSMMPLSTITESPNLPSMIPKFQGSPVARNRNRISHLYETPLR